MQAAQQECLIMIWELFKAAVLCRAAAAVALILSSIFHGALGEPFTAGNNGNG